MKLNGKYGKCGECGSNKEYSTGSFSNQVALCLDCAKNFIEMFTHKRHNCHLYWEESINACGFCIYNAEKEQEEQHEIAVQKAKIEAVIEKLYKGWGEKKIVIDEIILMLEDLKNGK